ncbi:MAG TPA: FtsX-like permease family protein [Vicinamibacterales bacterium]|nr:FtsX-like permease family protein [Vicinamibacterales bacterium]
MLARVVSDLRETPGVESVTTANPSPFNDSLNLSAELRLEGESPAPSVAVKGPSVVSPDYFRTLGVPLRAGRTFTEAETALEDDVPLRSAIVSAEAARALFGDASPIGRRVVLGRIARSGEWRRQRVLDIIGVAGEARTAATLRAASPPPTVYESSGPILVYSRVYVKSSLPATEMAARVRRVLWTANARLLPVEAGTIADEVERLYPEDRASAWLLVTIAAVATLLGFAGVYAVTAHSVSERTREFGVRIALGASSSAVVRQAGRGVVTVAIAGVAAGLIAYGFASRLIAARLFGVTPLEPATIAMAMALLCLVVGVATWLPARRATRIDPVVALRE